MILENPLECSKVTVQLNLPELILLENAVKSMSEYYVCVYDGDSASRKEVLDKIMVLGSISLREYLSAIAYNQEITKENNK